jgi:hypothetical protein
MDMTLIVSMLCQGSVVLQVTDRLVTTIPHGKKYDELANKNIIYFAKDAIVSIGYTGPAFIGKLPTDSWIVWTLCGQKSTHNFEQPKFAVQISNQPIAPIMTIWQAMQLLKAALKKIQLAGSGTFLELVVIGWKGNREMTGEGTNKPVPFLWVLRGPIRGEFSLLRLKHVSSPGSSTLVAAPYGNMPKDKLRSLGLRFVEMINDPELPRDDLLRDYEQFIVDGIRNVSHSNKYVGEDCMSIAIWRPGPYIYIRVTFFPKQHHSAREAGVVDVPEEHTVSFSPWIIGKHQLYYPQVHIGGLGPAQIGRLIVHFAYAGEWVSGPDGDGRYRFGWEPQTRRQRPT